MSVQQVLNHNLLDGVLKLSSFLLPVQPLFAVPGQDFAYTEGVDLELGQEVSHMGSNLD